jgi:nucleoside-diphosphate-sugar epimerase
VYARASLSGIPLVLAIGERGGSARTRLIRDLDAAHLFRLALETAPAGSRLHAVADEGVPVRDIAGVISRRLNVPVVALPVREAGDHFGWLGHLFSRDCPASSKLSQQRLGWHPVNPLSSRTSTRITTSLTRGDVPAGWSNQGDDTI